jgi:hypothetical protein
MLDIGNRFEPKSGKFLELDVDSLAALSDTERAQYEAVKEAAQHCEVIEAAIVTLTKALSEATRAKNEAFRSLSARGVPTQKDLIAADRR